MLMRGGPVENSEHLGQIVLRVPADATGGEPIFDLQGKPAGKVSSGAYGYHVGKSLALAYLRPDISAGSELQVMVLGRPHRARVLEGAAFDPEGKRLRQ